MAVDQQPIIGLVLHFRTPQRTISCLHSMSAEGIRRVVIVDNSQDGGRSIAAMEGGLRQLRGAGIKAKLLTPPENLGFSAGVRAGLVSIGQDADAHVLLINSDAQLEPGSLSRMLSGLRDAGVVAPYAKSSDIAEPASPIVFYHPLLALYLKNSQRCATAYPSGTCLLIRNDYVQPDLFDREFFFYGEDVMLGSTLARRKIRFSGCEDAFVIHAGAASAHNGSMFYEYHMNRAHWLLARKLARNGAERFTFLLARCLILPLRALVRSVRFRSLTPWYGLLAATIDVIKGRCRRFTPPAT